MIDKNFDIIIIGAGVSGLILANEILTRTRKSVLILEREKKIGREKNLCFWNIPKNVVSNKADNRWKNISLIMNGKKTTLKEEGIEYLRIKYQNLYKFFVNRIIKYDNSKILMNQAVSQVKVKKDHVLVSANEVIYKSKLLFDSRMEKIEEGRDKLKQHFYGAEITFEEDILDNNEIILMDIQDKEDSFNFFYILPLTKKKALIETTYFSSKLLNIGYYKKDLNSYLLNKYNGKKYTIGFEEIGVIPMYKIKNINLKNCIKIGVAGNWAKQSTGYSLQNSFIYSKQIVDCILDNKYPRLKYNKFISFLDQTFCNFILKYPEKSKLFFENFFKKNKLSTLVNFLNNSASAYDILKIILRLPKYHLLESIFLRKK
ncbi:MAG: lycopene cyclase family protein [Pseudomonadota bacterium]|nr:lycopene cyclase family protein [Pseudomonadota bacterium]